MKSDSFVLGIDFGTDSVRALVVAASNGAVAGTSVVPYPRWAAGKYCDPLANRFRQHPRDYLEAMEAATAGALREAGSGIASRVQGIAADTTGSTPVLADRTGTPLALLPAFQDEPDAMFILWKDHTSVAQAERINALAHRWNVDYTQYEGGVYSSEWFWAKVLRVLETNPAVADGGRYGHRTLRLDPGGPHRRPRPGAAEAQPMRGGTQGDVARSVRRLPVRRIPGPASSPAARGESLPGRRDLDRRRPLRNGVRGMGAQAGDLAVGRRGRRRLRRAHGCGRRWNPAATSC